jgi:hypothetical protein
VFRLGHYLSSSVADIRTEVEPTVTREDERPDSRRSEMVRAGS